MNKPLGVCSSCHCHVRVGERACVHCGASLAGPGGLRRPAGKRIEVRRVLFVAALSTLGSMACGGRTMNGDVVGSCAVSGSTQTLSCGSPDFCACGSGGKCSAEGQCVSCDCTSDQECYSGTCVTPSTHSCYGSPPLLA